MTLQPESIPKPPDENRISTTYPTIYKWAAVMDPTRISTQYLTYEEISILRNELAALRTEFMLTAEKSEEFNKELKLHESRQADVLMDATGALSDYDEQYPPVKRKRKEKHTPRRRPGNSTDLRSKPPRPKPETTTRKDKKDPENPQVKAMNKDIDQWLGLTLRPGDIDSLVRNYLDPTRIDMINHIWPPRGEHYSLRWMRDDDFKRDELVRVIQSMTNNEARDKLLKEDHQLFRLMNRSKKPTLNFSEQSKALTNDCFHVLKRVLAPTTGLSISYVPEPMEGCDECVDNQTLEESWQKLKDRHSDVVNRLEQAKSDLRSRFTESVIQRRHDVISRWTIVENQVRALSSTESKRKSKNHHKKSPVIMFNK
ncbi:hypothetical protein GEMRC1_001741 [Eukaryota sp. GEM-RC1]